MSKWVDRTIYPKGGRGAPAAYELKLGELRITVVRSLTPTVGPWMLVCLPWFKRERMGFGSSEWAKHRALELLDQALRASSGAVQKLLMETPVVEGAQ